MFWIVTIAVILLDQISKYIVLHYLPQGEFINIIDGWFGLSFIWNDGASFSILEGRQTLFLIITVAALLGMVWLLPRIPRDYRFFRACLGAFTGGAIGNFIDRLRFGKVIDFLYMRYYTSNIADAFLTVSVILICLMLLFGRAGKLLEGKNKEKNKYDKDV